MLTALYFYLSVFMAEQTGYFQMHMQHFVTTGREKLKGVQGKHCNLAHIKMGERRDTKSWGFNSTKWSTAKQMM